VTIYTSSITQKFTKVRCGNYINIDSPNLTRLQANLLQATQQLPKKPSVKTNKNSGVLTLKNFLEPDTNHNNRH
jgi:hypothetical protein